MLACGFCVGFLTLKILPWILVWFGAFLGWVLFVARYDRRNTFHPAKWFLGAGFVFIFGTIVSVDLWTLFLVCWTITVAGRVVELRTTSSQPAQPSEQSTEPHPTASPLEPMQSPPAPAIHPPIQTPAQVATAARFNLRILQLLAGGMVAKTAMILLNIRLIEV